MKCPACGNDLKEHLEESAKQGRQHCPACGRCFEADGLTLNFGAPFPAMAGLEELTVPELKDLARAEDIDLGDATRKVEIVEVIQQPEPEAEPVERAGKPRGKK